MTAGALEAKIALESALDNISTRLGRARADFDGAAGILRELAHGRVDLLASVAGWKLARSRTSGGRLDPDELYAAGLLLLAGAPPDLVVRTVETLTSSWRHDA